MGVAVGVGSGPESLNGDVLLAVAARQNRHVRYRHGRDARRCAKFVFDALEEDPGAVERVAIQIWRQPERGDGADQFVVVDAGSQQGDQRLRLDQADVLLHPLLEPAQPVLCLPLTLAIRRHKDVPIAHLHRVGGDVVREQVERAAARQIEPRVVPVTGQDAVMDAAAVERKSHVGAAVVHCVDLVVVVEDGDRPVLAGHHLTPLLLQLRQAADADLAVRTVRHDRHLRKRARD